MELSLESPAAITPAAAAGLPNSHRMRSSQFDPFNKSLLYVLQELLAHDSRGGRLGADVTVSLLLANGSLSPRTARHQALFPTPRS